MTTIDCEFTRDRLDEWIAGRLPTEDAVRVEHHLGACAACQADAEAAEVVKAALVRLPASVLPGRDLLPEVERRIARRHHRRFGWGVAAAAVLVAVSAGLWWSGAGRTDAPPLASVPNTGTSAEVAAAELATLRLSDPGLSAPVRAALDRDLVILDAAIGEARAQLRDTPDDPVAAALVESAIRKKLGLLRRMGDYAS